MRIAVMGSGAIGGYFGARLARAGEDVVFIARGAQLRALQTGGLRVESGLGDFTVAPVQATDDPRTVGPVDAVLVCVKAWQVPEAAVALRPLLAPATAVVPLLNGVEAVPQLAAVLGPDSVLGGLCVVISEAPAPGLIRHGGAEPSVAFGELDGQRTPRVAQLAAAFARAGVRVEIPADIQAALWEKLLFVAGWGGVGAITRAPVGLLRAWPETRALLAEVMTEIAAVAGARGARLAADMVDAKLAALDALPPGATTSMQRDLMAGRPSELDAQTGAVVRLGAAAGVPTPANRVIYHSLLPQDRQARGLTPRE